MSVRSLTGSLTTSAPIAAVVLATSVSRKADRTVMPTRPVHLLRNVNPGSSIRIDLPHIEVVLSLSAEAADRHANGPDFPITLTSDAEFADPVMKHLLDHLDKSQGDENGDSVYADAIRLALVARWLKLRSHEQQLDVGMQKWRLKRALAYIEEHIDECISLADLAGAAGFSRMYFASRFRAATGVRPHDYILRRRIERAKVLLAQGNGSLVDVALSVGFQTQAHFTTVFRRFIGTTPGRWRAANQQSV